MRHFREMIDELPMQAHLAFHAGNIVRDESLAGSFDERRAEEIGLVMRRDPVTGVQRAMLTVSFVNDLEKCARNNLDATTPEQWKLLHERSQSTRQPLFAAMYSDLLWAERRTHRLPDAVLYARAAIAKYADAARERRGAVNLFLEALDACRSLIAIAREVTDLGAILVALRFIGELVDALESVWRRQPGWPLRSAKAIIWAVGLLKKAERSPEILAEVRAMLARLERLGPDGDAIFATPVGPDILNYRAALEKILGIDTGKVRQRQCAESMLRQAHVFAAAGDKLTAGAVMMSAVKAFAALGETEQVTSSKQQVRDFFAKSGTQMQTFWMEVITPAAPLEAWLARVTSPMDLTEVLRRALEGPDLIPSRKAACDAATRTAISTPLLADMPAMTLVDNRPVSAVRDGRADLENRHWLMSIQLRVRLAWRLLVEKLKLEKGITADSLVDDLRKAGIVPDHNAASLRRAIEAGLSADHRVACHMLPPIIESALRHTLAARGSDVIAFSTADGGKLLERMGVFFDDDAASRDVQAAKRALGDDLWAWYRTVLFDETGMNLRNRAAHGLLRDRECTQETTDTLLLALVALLRVA